MNKLVLALATAAALGLSTAAFAENPAVPASTASTQKAATPSTAPAHKMRASHRLGAKHQTLHHKVTRHYGNNHGKRVAVKHLPAKKTVSTKTAS